MWSGGQGRILRYTLGIESGTDMRLTWCAVDYVEGVIGCVG